MRRAVCTPARRPARGRWDVGGRTGQLNKTQSRSDRRDGTLTRHQSPGLQRVPPPPSTGGSSRPPSSSPPSSLPPAKDRHAATGFPCQNALRSGSASPPSSSQLKAASVADEELLAGGWSLAEGTPSSPPHSESESPSSKEEVRAQPRSYSSGDHVGKTAGAGWKATLRRGLRGSDARRRAGRAGPAGEEPRERVTAVRQCQQCPSASPAQAACGAGWPYSSIESRATPAENAGSGGNSAAGAAEGEPARVRSDGAGDAAREDGWATIAERRGECGAVSR
ncbi:hypothetical protein DFJ74DRAFT_759762 [Hyaloraphidium curvatum]|nr:hypothetical protein DFJ74DRAFT_759762 [Hyaloraphidium curvatum]